MILDKLKKLTNKELAERFPFMIVKDMKGDIIYDFDDKEVPLLFFEDWGWRDIQLVLAEHIKPIYDRFDDEQKKNFWIIEVKEKFGKMRTSFTSFTPAIANWVNLAEHISSYTCIRCGKTEIKYEYSEASDGSEIGAKKYFYKQTTGWINPYCEKCAKKFNELNYTDEYADLYYEYEYWEPNGPKILSKINTKQFWKLEEN